VSVPTPVGLRFEICRRLVAAFPREGHSRTAARQCRLVTGGLAAKFRLQLIQDLAPDLLVMIAEALLEGWFCQLFDEIISRSIRKVLC
jgi:hypothetical protein